MRKAQKAKPDPHRGNQLHDSLWRLDQGFSAALAIVAIALFSLLFTGLGTALGVAHTQLKTQLGADLAALTAADTMAGAVAGLPCENAELIASADGAFLTSCRIVGLGVVVTAKQNFGVFEVIRSAEASIQH